MKDNVSIIIGLVGIILAIAIYYKQKNETKGISNFFLFVSTADKRISLLARRLSSFFFTLIMLVYILLEVIKDFKLSIVDEPTMKILMIISLSAMFLSVIAQTILNRFVVFKDNDLFDKLLDKDKQKLSDYKESLDCFCVLLISIGPSISIAIGVGIVGFTTSILLALALQAVYCSYLHAYFE